ncbi:hypothetical protein N7512_008594 [Penicillium capsulatum]|nr:hypothetical protein N7512_008594 [Penicillium capsulatum]
MVPARPVAAACVDGQPIGLYTLLSSPMYPAPRYARCTVTVGAWDHAVDWVSVLRTFVPGPRVNPPVVIHLLPLSELGTSTPQSWLHWALCEEITYRHCTEYVQSCG